MHPNSAPDLNSPEFSLPDPRYRTKWSSTTFWCRLSSTLIELSFGYRSLVSPVGSQCTRNMYKGAAGHDREAHRWGFSDASGGGPVAGGAAPGPSGV